MHKFHIYEVDVQIGEQWGLSPEDAIERFCKRNGWDYNPNTPLTAICDSQGYPVPRGWACV